MGISLVIGVTDDDWFEMLRARPDLTEVNFWAPSAANFRALQPGELFLFKLHSPRNSIVGGVSSPSRSLSTVYKAKPCSASRSAL